MEKVDYKHGRFILATTDADGFEYEDYLDFCEGNDIEPGERDSDEFWEWCREEANNCFEDDINEIRRCKQYNVPVVVTGNLGLWWGRPEVEPRKFDSVYDAVMLCIKSGDMAEVVFNDGAIEITARHHDGCNCFTINALSKKGQAKQDTPYNKADFKRLPYLYAIGI